MIASMTERMIRQQEQAVGESMDYLRDVARASRSAFFKFGLFVPLARHRTAAAAAALAVARLVATRHEDCAPCLQTAARFAHQDGVDVDVIRSVLASRPEANRPSTSEKTLPRQLNAPATAARRSGRTQG